MRADQMTVLITGATGGIGKALAIQLAKAGASLVLTARNEQSLAELKAEVRKLGAECRAVAADLTTEEGRERIKACSRQSPAVNVLINTAGTNSFASYTEQSEQQIGALIQTNLVAPMLLTRSLVEDLINRPEAMLVTIGSTFGSIGYPGYATYCASKFGLRGFHEALQRELADSRIHLLYVAPRATRTAINTDAVVRMNQELGNAMDDPAWVASQVIEAMLSDRRSAYLGWPEKLFVRLNALFPAMVTGAIVKQLPVIKKYLLQSS